MNMGPLLKALLHDAAFARTFLLSMIAFAVAYYTIDPAMPSGARIAIALGQTFLVGGSSALPARKNGNGTADAITRVGLVLAALLFLGGCSSVPTSSEGSVTGSDVTAKGGTITCAEGMGQSQPGPDGSVVPGPCVKGFAWTDPPAAEESTGLVKVVETVMKPLEILASAVARLVPGQD